jgi:hypothetical protein
VREGAPAERPRAQTYRLLAQARSAT